MLWSCTIKIKMKRGSSLSLSFFMQMKKIKAKWSLISMLKLQKCYFYGNTLKCISTEEWVETVYPKVISLLKYACRSPAQVRRKTTIYTLAGLHVLSWISAATTLQHKMPQRATECVKERQNAQVFEHMESSPRAGNGLCKNSECFISLNTRSKHMQ